MIVQLTGNVKYPITLDPTVWIFDDRKIEFDHAFDQQNTHIEVKEDELQRASERFAKEVYQQKIKPPINKSISRFEREKILTNTYVMPIKDFIATSEINSNAKEARIQTNTGDEFITIEQLNNCLLLFAQDGKPLADKGPVHLFFEDGSNKDQPIKGINKIIIE